MRDVPLEGAEDFVRSSRVLEVGEDNRGSANSEIGNSSRRISKAEGTKGILNIARYVKSPIKPDVKIAELVGTRRELVNLRTV